MSHLAYMFLNLTQLFYLRLDFNSHLTYHNIFESKTLRGALQGPKSKQLSQPLGGWGIVGLSNLCKNLSLD